MVPSLTLPTTWPAALIACAILRHPGAAIAMSVYVAVAES